jgi:hypothetical protein
MHGLLRPPGEGSGSSLPDKTRYYGKDNRLALVTEVKSRAAWEEIAARIYENECRGTRYLIPVENNKKIPPFFLNIGYTERHDIVLKEIFKDQYPDMTYDEYVTRAIDPVKREFYTGNLVERIREDGSRYYTFTVWHNVYEKQGTITEREVEWIHARLKELFTLGDLSYDPFSRLQRTMMAGWSLGFPVYQLNEVKGGYEPYNLGTACGRLRFYTLKGLSAAERNGDFGYQDILVLDEAPLDIQTVVAGIITGTRQGELSHLSVRSAQRHTPNCHIAGASAALGKREGELVRLVAARDGWTIMPVERPEAEAWWRALKPAPVLVEEADYSVRKPENLLFIGTKTAEERAAATRAYGSKATNLSILYRVVEPQYRLKAFAIPVYWYGKFMTENRWVVLTGTGERERSFRETIEDWLSDSAFLSDGKIRRERLGKLRTEMSARPIPVGLTDEILGTIKTIWGNSLTMVRFRSSSNAEDSLSFSGAGLYDSRSGCAADETDNDTAGPCRCDRNEKKEKAIGQAVTAVWASLWNDRAFEERSWYGINHLKTAMGILVNSQSGNEKCNIVAFTGNPGAEDNRYLFNAQIGDMPVVSAGPGIFPEKALIRVRDGNVESIQRVCFSSEAVTDIYILNDVLVAKLSGLLWKISETFPVDAKIPVGYSLLFDTEWKVDSGKQLIIKQLRPFLRKDS